MKIQLSDPDAAAPLVAALEKSDCLAAQIDDGIIAVSFPWLQDARDAYQARMELVFFLRAWANSRPGLVTLVSDEG